MDVAFVSSVAGTMASLLGLVVAIIQSIRIRELRRRSDADAWQGIRTIRSLISKLENSEARHNDPYVAEAYAKAVELYRHLLKQAALAQRRFSEATIQRWKQEGKLENQWQVSQARQFLPS